MPKEKTEAPVKQNFSEFEEHRHLMAQWAGLGARRAELTAEVQQLEMDLANKGTFGNRISQAAKALLKKVGVGSLEPTSEELRTRLKAAREESLIHDEALKQLGIEQTELEEKLSKVIAQGLLPKHRELVKALADAVVKLEAANQAEAAFRESLSDAGIQYGSYIRPMQFPNVGKISDLNSQAFAFLQECRDQCQIDGLEQFFVSPVQTGPKMQVRLKYVMAGPDGCFDAGSVISTNLAQYLLETRQAQPPSAVDSVKAAAKRDALKHDALMSGKEQVLIPEDSEWVPTK